ncbi:uncharacterized protein LOC116305324 [Actinia tenebrosa]|uniref:Uncharacterized protein LOC116305324 n=1 Tax=Actinia tenebrosa TaxID=6105 RepID=A0A6P8IUT7_ACTTE|nr:uncharacterized protein LOC116305324 [Actinia tenebrosa]
MIVLMLFIFSLATALPKGSKTEQNLKSLLQTVHNLDEEKPETKVQPEATGPNKSEPKFSSPAEKLKWRLNNARKKLSLAKEYLKLAEKFSKKEKDTQSSAQQESVRSIISRAEKQVLHSGEKMGLSYIHYKRSTHPI